MFAKATVTKAGVTKAGMERSAMTAISRLFSVIALRSIPAFVWAATYLYGNG